MMKFRILYLGRTVRHHLTLAATLLVFLLVLNIIYFRIYLPDPNSWGDDFKSVNTSAGQRPAKLAVIITGIHTGNQSITDYINLNRKLTFVISPSAKASDDMAKLASVYGCEFILGMSAYECSKLQAEFRAVDNNSTDQDPEHHEIHNVFARFPKTQGLDVRPAGNSRYRRFVEDMLPAVSVWGGYILIDDTWTDISSDDTSNSLNCDFEIIASKGIISVKRLLEKAMAQALKKGESVVVIDTSNCSSVKTSRCLSKSFEIMEKQGIELVLSSQLAE